MNNDERRTCDIVMKGGITSGVVYPKAISTISERFTFKNIGGTSAGAIAAAVTAAAEYKRQKSGGTDDSGFAEINTLGTTLAQNVPETGTGRLLSLFAPNSGNRRIFNVLLSAIGHNSIVGTIRSVITRLLLNYWPAAIFGALPGALLAIFSYQKIGLGPISYVWLVLGIVIALFGLLLVSVGVMAIEFVFRVPKNGFGLCNGMSDESMPKTSEPLTVWLGKYLQKVANLDPNGKPLTFRDIKWPNGRKDDEPPVVNLEMMTTNLTHGRPFRLPFRDDGDLHENHLFYFNEKEFRLLFPDNVVDHMKAKQRDISLSDSTPSDAHVKERELLNADGFYAMPLTDELPIIVATRMSLSFPILLSAIPLYSYFLHRNDSIDPKPGRNLKKCWFTDGGVCSNFPLHFFDGPMPKRPTFSLDLVQVPDDGTAMKPWMASSNSGDPAEHWNRFEVKTNWLNEKETEKGGIAKLFGFGFSLIETMQNWNDATQSRLPGYRDRIVSIPLTSELGGLNLNMDPKKIDTLTEQGRLSAVNLLGRFDVKDEVNAETGNGKSKNMTWENHRWVRLRSQMAATEKMLNAMIEGWNNSESGDRTYKEWLTQLSENTSGDYKDLSYEPTKKQIDAIRETIELIEKYPEIWNGSGAASANAPKPRTVLRHRAQI